MLCLPAKKDKLYKVIPKALPAL